MNSFAQIGRYRVWATRRSYWSTSSLTSGAEGAALQLLQDRQGSRCTSARVERKLLRQQVSTTDDVHHVRCESNEASARTSDFRQPFRQHFLLSCFEHAVKPNPSTDCLPHLFCRLLLSFRSGCPRRQVPSCKDGFRRISSSCTMRKLPDSFTRPVPVGVHTRKQLVVCGSESSSPLSAVSRGSRQIYLCSPQRNVCP